MAETIIKATDANETEDLMNLLNEFSAEERRELLSFAQGVKFARNVGIALPGGNNTPAA